LIAVVRKHDQERLLEYVMDLKFFQN